MNNVINTQVKYYRNVKDFKFCPKIKKEERFELLKTVSNALKYEVVDDKNLEQNLVKFLSKKYKNIEFSLFDNEHLTLKAFSNGFVEEIFKSAKEIINELGNKISFSYSDNLGFLMSDITKLGAGLSISADIDLCGIKAFNKISQVKNNLKNLGYSLTEKQGSIYSVSTTCNLGYSDSEISLEFKNTLQKLQELEVESEKMLDSTNHDEIMDKTLRSLGILNSAYLLTYEELNNLISNLRLGLNLNMLNLSLEDIIKLQSLVKDNNGIISQSEMKKLASETQRILKGGANV